MSSSTSFEKAKEYQIPSKSMPCVDDDHPQLSSNRIPSNYDHHHVSNSQNQPPSQQPPARPLPSKDQRLSQQPPARTLPSNVNQPEKDNHAKLTSGEPVVDFTKTYFSRPDGPPSQQQQQQQPSTRTIPSKDHQQHLVKNPQSPQKQPLAQTHPSSVERTKIYDQPLNHAKRTSDEPPRIYSESYLSPSAPQPDSSNQTLPPKDQPPLKKTPLPPSPSPPQPPVQTLPSNFEQPAKYNHVKLASDETETCYPENYLSQSDGPPPRQTYPLAQIPPSNYPHDLPKNATPMPSQTPSNVKQPTIDEPVTVYPEKQYYSPPPPPPPPQTQSPVTDKKCPCSIL